jgi:RNA polymerase sigma-70 factor (sigma-E family)
MVGEPDGFRDYVVVRSAALVRSAWLLTGDEGTAQDLVQTALAKTWSRWERLARQDSPDAYVRRAMVSTFLNWKRRKWNGELAFATLPDRAQGRDMFADVDERTLLRAALRTLPRRQRAVLVLRYFDDLTEAQAAAALGCSIGTVKSQTSKALATLRRNPQLIESFEGEAQT